MPHTCRHTHMLLSTARGTENTSGAYLYYPNESFQLVDVELQVHAVCQPSAYNTHGAGVPLLQERHDFSSNHARAVCDAPTDTGAPSTSSHPPFPPASPLMGGHKLRGETGICSYIEFPCMSF